MGSDQIGSVRLFLCGLQANRNYGCACKRKLQKILKRMNENERETTGRGRECESEKEEAITFNEHFGQRLYENFQILCVSCMYVLNCVRPTLSFSLSFSLLLFFSFYVCIFIYCAYCVYVVSLYLSHHSCARSFFFLVFHS